MSFFAKFIPTSSTPTQTALAIAAATTVSLVASFFLFIKLSKAPSRTHWSQLIFGHRGCRNIENIPENTINAFQYFIDHTQNPENNKDASGKQQPLSTFAGVEFDVRLCKSGELVVFHDAFAYPLFDVEYYNSKQQKENQLLPLDVKIVDLTLTQLRELPYRDDPTKSIRVCTAEEALQFCKQNKLKVLLELKGTPGRVHADVARLVDLYRNHHDKSLSDYLVKESTVISFQPMILYHLRKICPEIATFQLMRRDAASILTNVAVAGAPTSANNSTASASVSAKPVHHEPVPTAWAKYPKFFDKLLWIVFQLAPFIHGSSGVSPAFDQMTAEERSWWSTRGYFVYLWGYKKPSDFSQDMKVDKSICIAMDDEYGSYVFEKK